MRIGNEKYWNVNLFIITTLYNNPDALEKTLDSLLFQTKTNFIHYIYDDASSISNDIVIDNYLQKIRSLKNPFKVIVEKGEKNLGVDKAHEVAFRKMQGTHVMWLDQGDYLEKDCVEVITKTINKYPGISWFHLNSAHYDFRTNKIISKNDNTFFKKKNLYAQDQLPSFVFGNFYYHNFVIKISDLLDVFDGSINFIDMDKHGGFFYDAQIVFRFVALKKKMHYIKKRLSCVMLDHKSIASSFSNDSTLRKKCIRNILDSSKKFGSFSPFYFEYSERVENVKRIRFLCMTKEGYLEAKSYYSDLIMFLKKHHLPIYFYFQNKMYYLLVLLLGSNTIGRRFL